MEAPKTNSANHISKLANNSTNSTQVEVPSDSTVGRHASVSQSKHMTNTKKAIIGLIVAALVLLSAGFILSLWIKSRTLDKIERIGGVFPQESVRPSAAPTSKNVLNFLVLGSDSRISAGDPKSWTAGAQRTDTMMLMQINQEKQTLTVMSLPRDSWVNIPGYHQAKINAAFSYGGPNLAIQTVENLTGVRIDHFAMVDFSSFQKITDVLGGVTINTSDGKVTMNGKEALDFVRKRYGLAHGDFDRIKRQQAWVRAITTKLKQQGIFSNPGKVISLAEELSSGVSLDDRLDNSTIISLAMSIAKISENHTKFITAPYTGTGRSEDGQSIVNLDFPKLGALMEAWKSGDAFSYVQENQESINMTEEVVN